MEQAFSLEELSGKSPAELYKMLGTASRGLSSLEAKKRLGIFGKNEIEATKPLRPFILFLEKFKNPVILLLIGAAIVSAYLGSAFNSFVIVAMVLMSAVIDFINSFKSEKAALTLKNKVTVTATALRDGEFKEIPMRELVPGDVIQLEAGDLIPADGILIEERDVFVNESILTGESFPAEKSVGNEDQKKVMMGTSVISGTGLAVVAITGVKTKVGQIASALSAPEEATDFDKSLSFFSFFIFRVTVFLIALIFIINAVFPRGLGMVEVFLFAVAIAVGLTPELLPMIVTTNLARSAIQMSKDGVIVKKLSAIHNLGGMDVFCTDKTGTLTEDKIELIRYVNGKGEEDIEVLEWSYLSSVHVTGIRGALDHAVIGYKKMDVRAWEKVDEIPFDYIRKRDTVVVAKGDEAVLIAKGAPEEIFKVCAHYGKKRQKFSQAFLKKAEKEYETLSADGFRVLGVAIKKEKRRLELYSKDDEAEMTFLGFLAFLDPPKQTVKETLRRMEEYHVGVKIITGDNRLVAEKIARELAFPVHGVLTNEEIDLLADEDLKKKVETANLFVRVTPNQKERIIKALRDNGHVVGYMGDGVNDVLSLKAADVGISVNNATDVAKDTADIILLKKGLHEIVEGVVEGRKTYANIFKYLMMALSSNFGNMVSMPVASIFLPFLPMTASQIILNNFLYDVSQFTIPFDSVSKEFLAKPKKFNIQFLKKFMIVFGPLSSFFDLLTFGLLFFVFGLRGAGFQTGWFLESIATQALVVNIIRSRKPFFKNLPSPILLFGSLAIVVVAWILPFTFMGKIFEFVVPNFLLLVSISAIVILYLLGVEMIKRRFYAKWGDLIEK